MLKRILLGLIEGIIRNIEGPAGIKIRYLYYQYRLGECGKGVVIDTGVVIQSPKDVYIGNKVWIDRNVIILAGRPNQDRKIKIKKNENYKFKIGELHIEDEVHIAPFVVLQSHGGILIGSKSGIASGSKLYSLSHHYRNLADRSDNSTYYFTPMTHNDNQALILAPIVIGHGCAISLDNIVLPGATVPDGTWMGTGMIVSGNSYLSNHIYSVKQDVECKSK